VSLIPVPKEKLLHLPYPRTISYLEYSEVTNTLGYATLLVGSTEYTQHAQKTLCFSLEREEIPEYQAQAAVLVVVNWRSWVGNRESAVTWQAAP
jgi:hypothetical protein